MFKEIPTSKSNRKLVFGVGTNDAWYKTEPRVKGEKVRCPFYVRWHCMLKRCYSIKFHEKQPTYIDCTVCTEWLIFSNFKQWMQKQDWQNKQLDKDLLIQGNKIYSPVFCIFVTRQINTLLNDRGARRGLYPQGVSFDNRDNRFVARLSINGKHKGLGRFTVEEQAHAVYLKAKYAHIKQIALQQSEPLRSALLNYKIKQNQT